MIAAAFLHGEIDGAAIGRPLGRTLTIVNCIPDFVAIAAVGVHDPDVGIFHGGFTVGEATARATIDDGFAVRRPSAMDLSASSSWLRSVSLRDAKVPVL